MRSFRREEVLSHRVDGFKRRGCGPGLDAEGRQRLRRGDAELGAGCGLRERGLERGELVLVLLDATGHRNAFDLAGFGGHGN